MFTRVEKNDSNIFRFREKYRVPRGDSQNAI